MSHRAVKNFWVDILIVSALPERERPVPVFRPAGDYCVAACAVEGDLLSLAEYETGEESRWNRPRKRRISLRGDVEVVDWFKSNGPGYQTRINYVPLEGICDNSKTIRSSLAQ